jgi:hypothetical protein
MPALWMIRNVLPPEHASKLHPEQSAHGVHQLGGNGRVALSASRLDLTNNRQHVGRKLPDGVFDNDVAQNPRLSHPGIAKFLPPRLRRLQGASEVHFHTEYMATQLMYKHVIPYITQQYPSEQALVTAFLTQQKNQIEKDYPASKGN